MEKIIEYFAANPVHLAVALVLKTKPPIYFLTIDKKTVELTGKQLNRQQSKI